MEIPFLTNDIFDGNYPVNLYFHPEGWNGRPALIGTPGLLLWRYPGNSGQVRMMYRMSDDLMYAVVGNTVYKVPESGSIVALGTIGTIEGPISAADSGPYLMFVDGVKGYYIKVSTHTLTEITSSGFVSPSYVAFQDGFFLVLENHTDYIHKSALRDPTDWAALDYIGAERFSDHAFAIISDHAELLVFGAKSVEVFYNSGAAAFPFTRVSGVFVERGIGAPHSLAKIDNSLFWLSDDWVVRRMEGYVPVVISRPDMNTKISKYKIKSDAIGFSYYKDGNAFYVLIFPSENATWQYNAATKQWNRMAYSASHARHRANCYCYFAGKHLVGDYGNGKIYSLKDDVYTDDGEVVRRERIVPPVFSKNREKLFWHRVEVEHKAGVGLVTGQGDDPQAMLDWSDNGGRTWSNEHWRKIGKIGAFGVRSVWRMLGSSRNRILRWSMTDPVECVITGVYADISEGNH